MIDFAVFWCCRTGLNCRPLPYQGSALPLSYGSICPGNTVSAPWPRRAAGSCHKGPPRASTREHAAAMNMSQKSPSFACRGPAVAGWDNGAGFRIPSSPIASRAIGAPYSQAQQRPIDRESMKQDDKDKPSSRQDRLKLALRENLKRRKSQARGRSEAGTPSSDAKISRDDANGEGQD